MLRIIFTIDYEIHGNGDGCPQDLMIEPTYRLLRLCDKFGARMTIMADVAEILKFKEYKDRYGHDDYYYEAIVDQLRYAIQNRHDIQLHIHSSYFNARYANGRWIQDLSEYNFAGLPFERMDWIVKTCKEFLEILVRPIKPTYSCIGFRAANWSVSPSRNVVRVLIKNGIKIDTSIFKYGRRQGIVNFDYSRAYSKIVPWRVKEDDICDCDDTSQLWELPIYSEKRWIGAFMTSSRIYRALMSLRHNMHRNGGRSAPQEGEDEALQSSRVNWVSALLQRHAWKADFNQCRSKQLINALHRVSSRYEHQKNKIVPFVLIGHSKLFTKRNETRLKTFLAHCAQRPDKFGFDTLSGVNHSLEQWKTL